MGEIINIYLIHKRLALNSLPELIRKTNSIFNYVNKKVPNVFMSFSHVKEIDLMGILFLFKILEFTVSHNCFNNPAFNLTQSKVLQKEIKYYGFDKLLYPLTSSKSIADQLKGLKVERINEFIFAPICLYKDKNYEDKRNQALDEIQNYYKEPEITVQIFNVFTELSSNYANHAEEESYSIIAMRGNDKYIEFACADTGIGIVNTLTQKYPNKSPQYIIRESVKEGETSKEDSSHLGQGLWMISNLIANTDGRMEIYSDRGHLSQVGKRIKTTESPYWKGTIIYCKVFINDGIKISLLPDNDDIKLNVI